MRIVFIGGVKMGYDCAEALLKKKAQVAGIICLPDSFSSRSGFSDFSDLGKKFNVPVFKYQDVNNPQAIATIKELAPDLILVIGWSGIIGEEILAIPKKGVLGHHPTMLPKHRGNAPIPWTLINGLAKSGVTLFFLENEIDAGGMAGQTEFAITLDDDAASVYEKATNATSELLLGVLEKMNEGTLVKIPQDQKKASRWGKRKPDDGITDWCCMSIYLYNWIRGLTHPYPGAFTFLEGKKLFIWKATIAKHAQNKGEPGEILSTEGELAVKTGDGAIVLASVQLEGEEEMSAAEFVKKNKVKEGIVLG